MLTHKTPGGLTEFLRNNPTTEESPDVLPFLDWKEPVTMMCAKTGRTVTLDPPEGGGRLTDAMLIAQKYFEETNAES